MLKLLQDSTLTSVRKSPEFFNSPTEILPIELQQYVLFLISTCKSNLPFSEISHVI